MQALILTNEYPPNVYGGAGVHVEYLTRELAKLIDVDVRAFGLQDEQDGRLRVRGYGIAHDLTAASEQLRPDPGIGETVMAHLRELDDVAYVRFASVYRNFREAKDFETALAELASEDEPPKVSAGRK